jgi:hypothetical protein
VCEADAGTTLAIVAVRLPMPTSRDEEAGQVTVDRPARWAKLEDDERFG